MGRLLFLLLLIFGLAGCGTKKREKILEAAADLMNVRPDSVLVLLENAPLFRKCLPEERAAYALLYTEALYKSGKPVGSDSLLRVAWAYYSGSEDIAGKAEVSFYLGRFYGEADSVRQAVRYLVNAEQYALKTGDNGLLGRIYNEFGRLHTRQYIIREALAHYRKARLYSQLAGDTVNENYATGNMAKCFLHLNQPDSAWKYGVVALEKGNRRFQLHLQDYFTNFYLCRDEMPPVRETALIYDSLFPGGKKLFHGEEKNRFPGGSALQWQENKKRDTCEGEYFCLLKYERGQDSLSPVDREDYIFQVEDKYRNEHLMNRNYQLEIANFHKTLTVLVLVFVIVVLLLLAWLIVVYHRRMVKEKNEAIKEYAALIEALREEHRTSQNSLMEKLNGQNMRESELKRALEKRLDIIKHLTDLSFRYGDSSRANEVFCRKVKELMNVNMLTQDVLADLLEIVNINYGGIVDFLRQHYGLSREELELCSFVCSGFTPQEMSVLYNVSVNNIYLRCSRLGKKMGLEQPLSAFIREWVQKRN